MFGCFAVIFWDWVNGWVEGVGFRVFCSGMEDFAIMSSVGRFLRLLSLAAQKRISLTCSQRRSVSDRENEREFPASLQMSCNQGVLVISGLCLIFSERGRFDG